MPVAEFGDKDLRIKVGDAISQTNSPDQLCQYGEIQEERRRSGEQQLGPVRIRAGERLPRAGARKRSMSMTRRSANARFVVRSGRQADGFESAAAECETGPALGAAGKPDEADAPPGPRQFGRVLAGILTDRAEIRRQPVHDVKQVGSGRRLTVRLVSRSASGCAVRSSSGPAAPVFRAGCRRDPNRRAVRASRAGRQTGRP